MKAFSVAGALALAMTFGTAMAFAQSTPAPHIGDGTNSVTPAYPYNVGGGSAHVGDGGNSGPAPTPYYSGTGSAQKGSTQYGQGSAQSLAPPPGMAQPQQSAAQSSGK